MESIVVGRYSHSDTHGWGGWIEPESKEWILFVPATEGLPEFYLRDPRTGAVLEEKSAAFLSEFASSLA